MHVNSNIRRRLEMIGMTQDKQKYLIFIVATYIRAEKQIS